MVSGFVFARLYFLAILTFFLALFTMTLIAIYGDVYGAKEFFLGGWKVSRWVHLETQNLLRVSFLNNKSAFMHLNAIKLLWLDILKAFQNARTHISQAHITHIAAIKLFSHLWLKVQGDFLFSSWKLFMFTNFE